MPPPAASAPDIPDGALAALAALYGELEGELAGLGVVCRACGRCCDFARNDYRLFASRLELALVLRHHPPPRLTPQGRCGFLAGGRCAIHPCRPLGCRIFFCDPAHKAREQDLYHIYQRRLRAIAERYRVAWDYASFFSPPTRPSASTKVENSGGAR